MFVSINGDYIIILSSHYFTYFQLNTATSQVSLLCYPTQSSVTTNPVSGNNNNVIIVGTVVPILFFTIGISIIITAFIFTKRNNKKKSSKTEEFLREFPKTLILTGINVEEKIGRGQSSTVYKGTFHGSEIALKLHQKENSFFNEVNILQKIPAHPNIGNQKQINFFFKKKLNIFFKN